MGRSKVNKGFTLIEVMIVVAILAILAAIIIPVFEDPADRKAREQKRVDRDAATLCIEGYKFLKPRDVRASYTQILDEAGNGIRCGTDNYTTVE